MKTLLNLLLFLLMDTLACQTGSLELEMFNNTNTSPSLHAGKTLFLNSQFISVFEQEYLDNSNLRQDLILTIHDSLSAVIAKRVEGYFSFRGALLLNSNLYVLAYDLSQNQSLLFRFDVGDLSLQESVKLDIELDVLKVIDDVIWLGGTEEQNFLFYQMNLNLNNWNSFEFSHESDLLLADFSISNNELHFVGSQGFLDEKNALYGHFNLTNVVTNSIYTFDHQNEDWFNTILLSDQIHIGGGTNVDGSNVDMSYVRLDYNQALISQKIITNSSLREAITDIQIQDNQLVFLAPSLSGNQRTTIFSLNDSNETIWQNNIQFQSRNDSKLFLSDGIIHQGVSGLNQITVANSNAIGRTGCIDQVSNLNISEWSPVITTYSSLVITTDAVNMMDYTASISEDSITVNSCYQICPDSLSFEVNNSLCFYDLPEVFSEENTVYSFDSSSYESLFISSENDTIYFSLSDFNGCILDTSVFVVLPDSFSLSFDSIISESCFEYGNGEIHVQMENDFQYFINSVETMDSILVNLSPGDYLIEMTDSFNCLISDTIEIEFSEQIYFEMTTADLLCPDQDLLFSPSITLDSLDWSPSIHSGNTDTLIIITAYLNDCPLLDTVSIDYPEQLSLEFNDDFIQNCADQWNLSNLEYSGGQEEYTFFINDEVVNQFDSLYTYSDDSIYFSVVDQCEDTVAISVEINQFQFENLWQLSDTAACEYLEYEIESTFDYEYEIDYTPDLIFHQSDSLFASVSVLDSSTSCTMNYTSEAWVEVFPNPSIEYNYHSFLGEQDQIEVHFSVIGDGSSNYEWIISSDTLNTPNFIYEFTETGYYSSQLMVTDSNGCVTSEEVTLSIEIEPSIYIPNAFTPYHDGMNDLFQPYGNFEFYRMIIFDRWGLVVYDGDQPWDGKAKNGNAIMEGVYVYKFTFEMEDSVIKKVGHVTVLY